MKKTIQRKIRTEDLCTSALVDLFFASQKIGFEVDEKELCHALSRAYSKSVQLQKLYGERNIRPDSFADSIDNKMVYSLIIASSDLQRVRVPSTYHQKLKESVANRYGPQVIFATQEFTSKTRQILEERCNPPYTTVKMVG